MINLEKYANDGRLTEPSDGTRFEWRKMIDEVKKSGRPLTEKESEKFKIKKMEEKQLENENILTVETKYLESIPRMTESLIEGEKSAINDCLTEDEIEW